MILLDQPYISDFVLQSIQSGEFQALDTGHVVSHKNIPLQQGNELLRRIKEDPSYRIHTTSENALKWIYDNLGFTSLPEKISLFKNKLAFRKLITDEYPDFFYMEANASNLDSLDIEKLPCPFIIKPAIGFFSMGVHKVFDKKSWEEVKRKIQQELQEIQSIYPTEVLSLETYIIEECIEGREYAFDAYFDGKGNAVVLGVMEHLFSGGRRCKRQGIQYLCRNRWKQAS